MLSGVFLQERDKLHVPESRMCLLFSGLYMSTKRSGKRELCAFNTGREEILVQSAGKRCA